MNEFKVTERTKNVWQLTDDCAAYLVCGSESALLIDTSAGRVDVKKLAEELTDKPIKVVNTHYHEDHTGCNHMFDKIYVHSAELDMIRSGSAEKVGINDGFVFDLGDRQLEVLHTPGHSPGGICLLDRENKVMFSGDMAADVPIFMMAKDTCLETYIESLERILSYEAQGFTLLNSHGTIPAGFDLCRKLISCARGIIAGSIAPVKARLPVPDKEVWVLLHKYENVGIFRAMA